MADCQALDVQITHNALLKINDPLIVFPEGAIESLRCKPASLDSAAFQSI